MRSKSKEKHEIEAKKRERILQKFKENLGRVSQSQKKKFGTRQSSIDRCKSKSKEKGRRVIESILQIEEDALRQIKKTIQDRQISISDLESIIQNSSKAKIEDLKEILQAASKFPIPQKQIFTIPQLIKLKDVKKINAVSQAIHNVEFNKQNLEDKQLLWNFIKPFLISESDLKKKIKRLKELLQLQLKDLLKQIFTQSHKELTNLFCIVQIKDQNLKYLKSLSKMKQTPGILTKRVKIILQGIEKKSKIRSSWRAENFDQIQLLTQNQSGNNLYPVCQNQYLNLPQQLKIQIVGDIFYEAMSTDGAKNNCLLNSLYGKWQSSHGLLFKDHKIYRMKFKEVLRQHILKIIQMDDKQYSQLSKSYCIFNNFSAGTSNKQKQFYIKQKKRFQLIQQLIELIDRNLRDGEQIDLCVLYWIQKYVGFNLKIFCQFRNEIEQFEFPINKKGEEVFIIMLNCSEDGKYGHYKRLFQITLDNQRFISIIQLQLKRQRLIKNKNQLNSFMKLFASILKKQKKFGEAFQITKLQWQSRVKVVNPNKMCKRQYTLSKRMGGRVIKLSEEQINSIQFLEIDKIGQIVIVREIGPKDSNLKKLIKWQNSDIQHIERIWLSSEGFQQIIWGLKIPDQDNKMKMTISPFIRAYRKIFQSQKNGIIIFENLEVLNNGQRDQLAQMLIDLEDGFLNIGEQKLRLHMRLVIILRTRSLEMLESWKYVSQISLKTLKKVEYQKECKEVILNQIQEINLKKENDRLFLNFLNKETKIPLSKDIQQQFKTYHKKKILSQNLVNIGDEMNKISETIMRKLLYRQGLIVTPETLYILAKCDQTVKTNRIFLVLEGPTGVGKTHIPTVYSYLTEGKKINDKLNVGENRLGNICFHRGKTQSELQGNFIRGNKNIEWKGDTTFAKVVEAGGVILLSQLNTVVKNRQASLAWYLKQLDQCQPDENGDREIILQSAPTHNKELLKIKVKKGTLIIVDINTKDYYGRISLPEHFVPDNRVKVKSLVTDTQEMNLIQQQQEVLSKYIEAYWDQNEINLQKKQKQLNQDKKKQLSKRNQKYLFYAKVFRNFVIAYEKQKFGKLTQEEINSGKTRRWIFSIREMQRIIRDIRNIPEQNKQEIFQIVYQHFALRWADKKDREEIANILADLLKCPSKQIKLNAKQFLKRNLQIEKRAVLWIMDENQLTITQELSFLEFEIQPKNIQTYKISHQVGEWQLLGGIVPTPNDSLKTSFQLGVLGKWLKQKQNCLQKHLLILENIDKMDINAVSVLNNFLQDLTNANLFIN